MKKSMICLAVIAALALTGCDAPTSTATQIESKKQEQLTLQGVQQVGLPAIVNFQEKRVLKQILELRDTKIVTITYISDLQGKLHKRCDSIGYGIPYATEYTNPSMVNYRGNGVYTTLPQADPNGLYSPASAEGTWVLCANPKKPDEVAPVYIEDRITVSPFPLTNE
jgi:hypothetical protein